MKYPFVFDAEKAIETILYITFRVSDPTFHRISKIMYFADKIRLEKYGRQICTDNYMAMKHGPVPSHTYDILKPVRGDGWPFIAEDAKKSFMVTGSYTVKPLRTADLESFSISDLKCLDAAICEYGELSFSELTLKSHDAAWEAADENDGIALEQIVRTFKNPEPILEYLKNPFPG